jgi:hypothetical protein
MLGSMYTRKNAQVVTNLQQTTCGNTVPTTCQQAVFPLLVQLVDKLSVDGLLTTCYKVVELNKLVTSCSNNFLSSCNSTICQPKLWVTTSQQLDKITALLRLVDKLATSHTFCWHVVRFLRVPVEVRKSDPNPIRSDFGTNMFILDWIGLIKLFRSRIGSDRTSIFEIKWINYPRQRGSRSIIRLIL